MQNLPSNGTNGYDVAWRAAARVVTGRYWSDAREREHRVATQMTAVTLTHVPITRVGTSFQLMP